MTIEMVSRKFRWTPQITVGGPYAANAQAFLRDFAVAARHAGLMVTSDLGPGP